MMAIRRFSGETIRARASSSSSAGYFARQLHRELRKPIICSFSSLLVLDPIISKYRHLQLLDLLYNDVINGEWNVAGISYKAYDLEGKTIGTRNVQQRDDRENEEMSFDSEQHKRSHHGYTRCGGSNGEWTHRRKYFKGEDFPAQNYIVKDGVLAPQY
ncbi:hypothetical protein F2Q69_00058358, partial [Brassica cretica]